jgi:hypothetical protein
MPADIDDQLFHTIVVGAMIGLDTSVVASPEQRQANQQRHDHARRQLEEGMTEIAGLLKVIQRQQTTGTEPPDMEASPGSRGIAPHVSDADVWETIRALFIN